jgi:sugar lactone lactonase YvrE
VDPNDGWSTTPLLSELPPERNPLVFPTGIAIEKPGSLLVCDTGLRWKIAGDQSNRSMAEPAAIFRVDLNQLPPVITRVTHQRKLVQPTHLVFDQRGDLIVTDSGESLPGTLGTPGRSWRARPNEFGVIVHFSQQRPTSNDERNRVRRGIQGVTAEQKPAHTTAWLKSN